MTPEQKILADLKAEIKKMPPGERENVMRYYHCFQALVVAGGPLAGVALTLVGAEILNQE